MQGIIKWKREIENVLIIAFARTLTLNGMQHSPTEERTKKENAKKNEHWRK